MTDQESDRDGLEEGLESSEGDLRVLFVMNLVLSALFGWTIVWGLSILGVVTVTLTNIATAAIVVFALTYVVTMR